MPDPLLHVDATVTCAHGGRAEPDAANARVLVEGAAVVTLSSIYLVTDCALARTSSPCCDSGRWLSGATRVCAGGDPVATTGGTSVCTPSGTPLLPVLGRSRVVAG